MVFAKGQSHLPVAAGAMVRNQDKDGVIKPFLFPGQRQKFSQSVIGILNGPVPTPRSRRDIDLPFREGKGAMVAGGHKEIEERIPLPVRPVCLFYRLTVQIAVGHTPGVLEEHFPILKIVQIHHPESIVCVKGIHVVKIASSPVEKSDVVAAIFEDFAQVVHIGVIGSFHQRPPGCRRDGEGDRFKSPDGPGAGRIETGEKQAFLKPPVHKRGEVFLLSEPGQEIGAEAFHTDDEDV